MGTEEQSKQKGGKRKQKIILAMLIGARVTESI